MRRQTRRTRPVSRSAARTSPTTSPSSGSAPSSAPAPNGESGGSQDEGLAECFGKLTTEEVPLAGVAVGLAWPLAERGLKQGSIGWALGGLLGSKDLSPAGQGELDALRAQIAAALRARDAPV